MISRSAYLSLSPLFICSRDLETPSQWVEHSHRYGICCN